ncbi:toxin-antitoxin system HicB family antitoxin [Pleurocapsa sp. PCC 7319]|uniref:toxin-antitoxin system HicB family antitoxin n=1 Tax=Pleurocapsa sp. PCC 7319 TaxID=118161 RepID=UPI003528180C
MAKVRGMSLNKLIDELGTIALAEFDAETKFKAMAARGSRGRGLKLLDELEQLSSEGKRTD